MQEKILREEIFQFRGRPVPLRVVQLPSGTFETRLLTPGMSIIAPFRQEERAQAYFEHLKKRFVK